MIVVDTNVIAYLVVPGDRTSVAERVWTKDPDWMAPKLWRSEMRNLLALYVRSGPLSLDDIRTYMANAERLLAGFEYDVSSDPVLTLSANSGCTAYDCEFISLAVRFNIPLVASDKQLLRTFPDLAISMDDFLRS